MAFWTRNKNFQILDGLIQFKQRYLFIKYFQFLRQLSSSGCETCLPISRLAEEEKAGLIEPTMCSIIQLVSDSNWRYLDVNYITQCAFRRCIMTKSMLRNALVSDVSTLTFSDVATDTVNISASKLQYNSELLSSCIELSLKSNCSLIPKMFRRA